MPGSDLSSKTVPPNPPHCATCGKKMSLIDVVPISESVIYEYLCSDDGDRLTWQPHHQVSSPVV